MSWPVRLAADVLRSPVDAAKRHRAAATLAGLRHARRWRFVRAEAPGRTIIAIGLVEHFGDIVAAEPIVRLLRRRHPEARLMWVVREPYRELVETHPRIDRVLTVGCLTEWMRARTSRAFDQIVDLHVPGRFCEVCNLPLHKPADDSPIHAGNYYEHGDLLAIYCRIAGLPVLDQTPRLHIPASSWCKVDALNLPERFVAIHARSNQIERDWSALKWRQLVETLSARGLAVVEVGLEPVIRDGPAGYASVCGRLSLLETAELIRRAQVFVGIDSGPAHLAHAVGTAGVILLGSYGRYRRYMPYGGAYGSGENAEVIQADGPASSIGVERVLEAVRTMRERVSTGPAAKKPGDESD